MKVEVGWDVADLAAIDSDLVGKHAGGRNLDGVRPVVVVVAERIGEVEDCVLRDKGGVLSYVEVSGLDCSLGHGVRHEEEIELALDDLRLLNETVVNIGSLGWVENVCLVLGLKLFEESLSNTLIDDDECDIGKWFSLEFRVIFVGEDFLELIELVLDDLLSH